MSNLTKDLMAATSIPMILTIIKQEESYGYEIIQKIKNVSENTIVWQEGSLYPVLKKMEKNELLRSRWSQTITGKKRKYYSITMKGVNTLTRHKNQWVHVDGILNRMKYPLEIINCVRLNHSNKTQLKL